MPFACVSAFPKHSWVSSSVRSLVPPGGKSAICPRPRRSCSTASVRADLLREARPARQPLETGSRWKTRLGVMMSKNTRVDVARRILFNCARDLPVQLLPARLEQSIVGCVLNERVFEPVDGIWRNAALKDQFGVDQLRQSGFQVPLRQRRNCGAWNSSLAARRFRRCPPVRTIRSARNRGRRAHLPARPDRAAPGCG